MDDPREMPVSLRGKCAIVGLGYTPQGRIPGRTAKSFCLEAAKNAIEDADLTTKDIDGILVQPCPTDARLGAWTLAQEMGISLSFAADSDLWAGWGAAAVACVQHAAMAIDAGLCRYALCVFGDSPSYGTGYHRYTVDLSSSHSLPYGIAGAAGSYAMAARRHMHEYGTTSQQFGAIAVAFRKHASLNPIAQMRQTITLEDHQNSRFIVEPFRLLDCCLPTSDGARAVVVTSAERAKQLRHRPVYIMGMGQSHPATDLMNRPSFTVTGAVGSGKRAFSMAGITPKDIDVALLYDCFTYTVLVQLEDLGFCQKGEGGAFVEEGRLELGGKLPTNTSGGLLSEAFFQGWTALSEGVHQLRGDCGSRQVKGAEIAIVTGSGGGDKALIMHTTMILRR